MSFAVDLQAQLDRLSAAGWTRDQIAKPTGYTPRQLLTWASGRDCKPALQTGLLVTLRGLKGRPPGKSTGMTNGGKPPLGLATGSVAPEKSHEKEKKTLDMD